MALENDDLIVVQKSGGGELRKAKISDIKPDAPDLQLTAELVFSAENNADVEWDTTVRALATVTGGAQPVALTYQWWNDFGLIVSDIAIAGATSATYKIPETKVGYSIWCVVKATDADGIEIEANTNKCVVTEKAVAAELWTEDSGKLYPTTLTNNVQVGGTAAAPNISLKADGSAELAGDVTITDGTNSRHEIKVLDVNGDTGALHDFKSSSGFQVLIQLFVIW